MLLKVIMRGWRGEWEFHVLSKRSDSNPRVLSDMGLAIRPNFENNNTNSKSWSQNHTWFRIPLTEKNNNYNYSFEQYLKAQKKGNANQILYYARRYHQVLETGDASSLATLQSGAVRRHSMEALTELSKYLGCYDTWCMIRKRYQLHWTNGDESIKAMEQFFNPTFSLDLMVQAIREMIAKTPLQWPK